MSLKFLLLKDGSLFEARTNYTFLDSIGEDGIAVDHHLTDVEIKPHEISYLATVLVSEKPCVNPLELEVTDRGNELKADYAIMGKKKMFKTRGVVPVTYFRRNSDIIESRVKESALETNSNA